MANNNIPEVPPDLSDTVQLRTFLYKLVKYLETKEKEEQIGTEIN